jgi:hypothetical protein
MNPIARMMKRYIKTPLKYALPLILIGSLVLVSISGCTSSTSNPTATPSATPSTTSSAAPTGVTQHDAFLEKFITAYKAAQYSDPGQHVQAWQLDWINSTSARIQFTVLNYSENLTLNSDGTITVFPTTQDATSYVNSMNLTAYSLARTEPKSDTFQNATGHAPQIYKEYTYTEGSTSNLSQYVAHGITQGDNLVYLQTVKFLS